MALILSVTIPFFALVLLGWLAGRAGRISRAGIAGLNGYVLTLALPAMLFRFGQKAPWTSWADPVAIGLYAACALVMVGLLLARARVWGLGQADGAFGALVGAFPNSGFMGLPMLVALLGPQAAGPVICTLWVDGFLTSALCLARAQWPASDHDRAERRAAILRALVVALRNPLPWSMAAGAAVGASGLSLPPVLDRVLQLLGDSASPVALYTVGGLLWLAGQGSPAADGRPAAPGTGVWPSAWAKLLLHPALVALAGGLAQRAGAPLADETWRVLVLTAALPGAGNAVLLGERYGADGGRVARIVMASTALALLSFSGLTWWLTRGGATA